MKRAFFFIVAITAISGLVPLYAQNQAVVKEFTGKVELKEPGKDWKPVVLDLVLAKGTMISTGFNSKLVLMLGATKLTVKPLTRMLLEEFVKKESTQSTSLVLKVGKVNAQVKSSEGERTEFTLKGPASTAAVRGTEFDYDGWTLKVIDGIVEFVNLLSQARAVGAGESSETDGFGFPTSGEDGKHDDSTVSGDTGGLSGGGGGGGGGGGYTPPVVTGTISVTVE